MELRMRSQLPKQAVDQVIMGTVVSNISTSNVARDAMLGAGFHRKTPAFTVTQACISANMAISLGTQAIRSGRSEVVIAGGTESLSDIPIRYKKSMRKRFIKAQRYRKLWDYGHFFKGLRFGELLPEIPSISEFSTGRTMGKDADLMAARFGISRAEQDSFAHRSHHLAAKAQAAGLLAKDVVPVFMPKTKTWIQQDNGIRGDTTLEKLAKLKPAFIKPYGTVTAGNASFLTDGAAAVLLMSQQKARELNYQPMALILDDVFTAQDPNDELLLGPAYAIATLLKRHKLNLTDVDVFEIHEAFAGQVLANLQCLKDPNWCKTKLDFDTPPGKVPLEKLNTEGGSLSLGHPFGATGARLLKMAARKLAQNNGRLAVIAACAAGGQGYAQLIQRYEAS